MGDHTEKLLCPDCGETVRVAAGYDLDEVHSCGTTSTSATTTKRPAARKSRTTTKKKDD